MDSVTRRERRDILHRELKSCNLSAVAPRKCKTARNLSAALNSTTENHEPHHGERLITTREIQCCRARSRNTRSRVTRPSRIESRGRQPLLLLLLVQAHELARTIHGTAVSASVITLRRLTCAILRLHAFIFRDGSLFHHACFLPSWLAMASSRARARAMLQPV